MEKPAMKYNRALLQNIALFKWKCWEQQSFDKWLNVSLLLSFTLNFSQQVNSNQMQDFQLTSFFDSADPSFKLIFRTFR